jgi:hypothetical protein
LLLAPGAVVVAAFEVPDSRIGERAQVNEVVPAAVETDPMLSATHRVDRVVQGLRHVDVQSAYVVDAPAVPVEPEHGKRVDLHPEGLADDLAELGAGVPFGVVTLDPRVKRVDPPRELPRSER